MKSFQYLDSLSYLYVSRICRYLLSIDFIGLIWIIIKKIILNLFINFKSFIIEFEAKFQINDKNLNFIKPRIKNITCLNICN